MVKTLREQFIKALLERGEKQVETTSKHVKFTRVYGGYYYIGKSGSLRSGNNKSTSIPVLTSFRNELLGIKRITSVS